MKLINIKIKILLAHVCVCLAIAGLVSYFSSAKWLAATFFISAAMYVNGVVATIEDARPGGFDNPDCKENLEFSHGFGTLKYLSKSLLIIVVLIVAGLYIQFSF